MSTIPAGSIPCLANALLNLRSSTDYNADHGVKNSILNFSNSKETGRFDGSESWSSSILDKNQFIVAGSDSIKTFIAISTQGRGDHDQWVTSYKLRYSLDNVNWVEYNNGQVYNANTDRNSIVTLNLNPPIKARSIAIHPQSYHNHISLRWELHALPYSSNPNPSVQMGEVSIGDRTLNSGTGNRNVTRHVSFSHQFATVPMVSIGCKKVDAHTDAGQMRWQGVAQNITPNGFDLLFTTWGDNNVYDLTFDYVAIAFQ
ncbi:hypothetical protein RB653_003972 [Dictyostelium firmibasis]|uniref:F5/8 type C domain-containing protein n=1 Tax=Dictyostelium firmibasis TaxID=79012 RepID=A0AAN7TYU6_9MYCE